MKRLYWLLPILLFIIQLIFILHSQTQIRYEELSESIRNTYWLKNHYIYDGVSSNVGWYFLMLGVFDIFGFQLMMPKFVKLAFFLVSFYCLAYLLEKILKEKHAWLPLLVIGLSPTLMFDTSLDAQYGIDFLIFPIEVLFVFLAAKVYGFKKYLVQFIVFALLLFFTSFQPSLVFYLPVVGMIYLWQVEFKLNWQNLLVPIIGFITPLIGIFAFVKNRQALFYDTEAKSGIFRGSAGSGMDAANFAHNISGFFSDLFTGGKSYHFEINAGDFSYVFPVLTILAVVLGIYLLLKFGEKIQKRAVLMILSYALLIFIITALPSDPSGSPGIRRFTFIVSTFYALFALSWGFIQTYKFKNKNLKVVLNIVFVLLFVHHLLVLPQNINHLNDPSPVKEAYFFSLADTPTESLDLLVGKVQKEDLKLVCLDEQQRPVGCRLAEVYAAVAGACEWNHLNCHTVLGYDINTDQMVPLSPELWNSYQLEH